MRWSDIGSWTALWEAGSKDKARNVARGDVWLHGARDCYVRADDRHVSVLGAEGLAIVETDDAVLVASRDRAQEVKDVVARFDRQQRTEHVSHTRVYRPWGYYESVDAGERFQVKRLMVKAGQSLSLQLHRRRAEHWVVVSGEARVTRGDEVMTLAENQFTYIPVGVKRFEDRYGRD